MYISYKIFLLQRDCKQGCPFGARESACFVEGPGTRPRTAGYFCVNKSNQKSPALRSGPPYFTGVFIYATIPKDCPLYSQVGPSEVWRISRVCSPMVQFSGFSLHGILSTRYPTRLGRRCFGSFCVLAVRFARRTHHATHPDVEGSP